MADEISRLKKTAIDTLNSMAGERSVERIVDSILDLTHRWVNKKYIETYRELVKKVAELEKRLAKEKEQRKEQEQTKRVIEGYHSILLKKFRLLVSPQEFELHCNDYDKRHKLDISDLKDKHPKKKPATDQDSLMENLKKKIDASPERNQARVQDLDPQYKKRVEESHKRLQEKVGLKDLVVHSKSTQEKEKEKVKHTLILDDSKELMAIKKSGLPNQTREYGFGADISVIEDYKSPGRKKKGQGLS